MSLPPGAPVRRRRGSWFADRPLGPKILALIGVSAGAGVLLCVVAAGRIGALGDSQRDLYENSVVAFSDLDAIQASYEAVRQGYTSYYLADTATRTRVKDQLAAGRAGLDGQIEAYARTTEHVDRFSTLSDDIAAYFAISDGQLVAALDAGDVATAGAVAAGPLVEVQNAVTRDFTGLRTVLREEADVQARAGADDASSAKTLLWAILGVSVGIGLVLALLVVRQIVRTVRSVQRSVDALAGGDPTVRPDVASKDELGRMAGALALAQNGLRDVSESVVTSADAVAAGADQMGASIREIASDAAEASEVAARAVTAAEKTTATVTTLGDSSADIGRVVKVITSIAEQTNLLALNATIEAARAGEAGKNFAVVANEVEEPAQETATAKEDIAHRVQAIQGDTAAAVSAIEEISGIVAQISDRQTTIASAVEKQTATIHEMSRSVEEAAGGTGQIAGNITDVSGTRSGDSPTEAGRTPCDGAIPATSRHRRKGHLRI